MADLKLLVRTPLTQDGITPIFDDNGKKQYRDSIVENNEHVKSLTAIENASRTNHMKHEVYEVEVQEVQKMVNGKVVRHLEITKGHPDDKQSKPTSTGRKNGKGKEVEEEKNNEE